MIATASTEQPAARSPALPEAADAALLSAITSDVATEPDLAAVLERSLEPIVRLAGARAGAVRVLADDDHRLHARGSVGLPAGLCAGGSSMDRHCGHCGQAVDTQRVVWAEHVGHCVERTGDRWFGGECRHLLAVPLQHRGRTLGVYSLFFAEASEPGPEVMALLRSIGELLGLALNNARLEREHVRAKLTSERQAMAAEVHDAVAQSLAFAKMRMPLLHDAIVAHDDAQALQYCDDLRAAMTQAHASLRGVLSGLRAPMDPRGLASALADCAREFQRTSGAELELVNELPALALGAEQESQIFHIVGEALANVARHAGARHARVHLARDPARLAIEVLIEDDGAGLRAAAAGGAHYGLEIMRERARRIGGTLEVGARPGGGTRVRLAVPAAGTEAAS